MSNRLNQSNRSSQTNKKAIRSKPDVGIVVDVILDETHPRLNTADADDTFFTDKRTFSVPSAIIRPLHDTTTNEDHLLAYKPYDQLDAQVPIIGETVQIIKVGSNKYYKRLSGPSLNLGNAKENLNKSVFSNTESINNSSDYNSTSQTGISNSTSGERDSTFGKYFKPQQINKLRLYEGDRLIQSRFGQSIRFSAYNNQDNSYAPSIIIRNRQNDEIVGNSKEGDLINEDVNKDGTIIAITSANHKLNFQPGSIDDGGSSNFETKPQNIKLPTEYKGTDQILVNSGRIIISSKNAEMLFFSKGDYGFISDGKFSIDNGKDGAEMDFNGNVNIRTNNNNFSVNTDKGNILLNTNKTNEPIARGQSTVDVITKLIDLILKQVYATPAGPSAAGPINRADFEQLKSELDKIKSTLNFTE
jgi:hypothetical protein